MGVNRGLFAATGACLAALVAWPVVGSQAAEVGELSPRAPHVVPPEGTVEAPIPLCEMPADLDCIQSVAIVRGTERIPVRLVRGGSEPQSIWSYAGRQGQVITFGIYSFLRPTGVVESWGGRLPGARFYVERQPDAVAPARGDADLDCSTGDRAACTVGDPPLPEGDSVEIAFRASWIRVLNVAVRGQDLAFDSRRVPGGTLFTMSARQDLLPRVKPLAGVPVDEWPTDAWDASLSFIIDHAGTDTSDSAYDPRCAYAGAPVAGHNAPAAGRPSWNNRTNSLDFAIMAPHRGPDGEIYRGYFQAQIPMSWLRCESGRKDLRANSFTIRVLGEDGEEQVATTALNVRNRTLYVQAFGFHYSSPTVQLLSKAKR